MENLKPKLHFIIADDDQDDQLLLLQAFRDNSVSFESASVYDGRQLLDYLLRRNKYHDDLHDEPDFILLDLNMPVQNGFDALKEIRGNSQLKNIPVYILSTSSAVNDKIRALGLGATRYFIKPYEYCEIKKLVNEVVGYC